jgi:hypothetical protein
LRKDIDLSESSKEVAEMQLIKKLFARDRSVDSDIFLRVLPISHGGFGVYANTVLIAIHSDQAAANAHCQRLRNQQAIG